MELSFTWPNLVTVLRILLIPVFVMAAMQVRPGEVFYRAVTLAVFVLVALGDVVDGWLARRLNRRTTLGAFLDPLGDKLLMFSAYIFLAALIWPAPRMPRWVSTIVISRDLLIALGFLTLFMVTGKFRIIRPSGVGKLTTGVQTLTIVSVITAPWVSALLGDAVGFAALSVLFFLTVFLTLFSGVDYLYAARVYLGDAGHVALAEETLSRKERA